jgi:hypothetical protein
MTSAPNAARLLPLVAVMAGLVCIQLACSLQSLDYLQNGGPRDGAIGNQDVDMSTPDTVSPSGALLDATRDEGMLSDASVLDAFPTLDSSGLDSQIRDSLVLDTRGEVGNNQGTDTSSPDTVGTNGGLLDASVLDAPPALDNSGPDKPDAPSRADTAFGGSTGTADARTPQGGAGGHSSSSGGSSSTGGNSSSGGSSSTGGASNSGGSSSTGGTSSTGGNSNTGGTGGTSLIDGGAGGQGATGGQAGAAGGADGGTSTTACSGVLHANICWYLGAQGSSCQQACASHGQPASGAASHVGTAMQGGSLAECGVILGLLGITGTPSTSFGLDGLGCFVRANGNSFWFSLPNFSATASQGNAKLVCGCAQ